MTSHEILKSSMLDILFENRNKQYGAYALRKFYANRMGVALTISLSSVLLLLFLFSLTSTSSPERASLPDVGVVELKNFEIPQEELPPPPPVEPPKVQQVAQVDFNNIIVVPDNLANEPLPTIDDIQNAVIGNDNIDGVPDVGKHSAAVSTGNSDATPAPAPEPEKPVFDPIEKQPEFPGGVDAWRNFLSRYLQAPDELAAGERKTVQVRFMVSATGEVTNFEIVQSAGTSFDREVLRVMKKMPKWTPAIQNGHKIGVSFVQPVTFQGVEE